MTFDLVLMSHALEHTIDPIRSLANAADKMSDGGRIVIEVPNNDCYACRVLGTGWPFLEVPRHQNFFNRRSLLLAFEQTGLRVEKIEYRGYSRQFRPEWMENQRIIHAWLDKPDSELRRWWMFLRTLFAGPDAKYDSIRMIGTRRKS